MNDDRMTQLPSTAKEILQFLEASLSAAEAEAAEAEVLKVRLSEQLLTGGLGIEAIENGETPKGWSRYSLGELCNIWRGKDLPAEILTETSLNMHTLRQVICAQKVTKALLKAVSYI